MFSPNKLLSSAYGSC